MSRLTRNELIEQALTKIGVKAAEEDASGSALNDAAINLNAMISDWQAGSPFLWKRDEAALFLQPAQVKYQIGDNSTDHATIDFTETTTDADASTGDTTLSLVSATGLVVADNISVRLDDGDLFWTTITIVSPLTLADSLPSDAASGAAVYYYTTDLEKALRVPDARRLQGLAPTTTEIEMVPLARIDYLNLPNKLTSGTPVQFYYDPKTLSGNMFIWPAPTKTDPLIKFTTERPFVGYTDSEDTGDFPEEWTGALIYNLATRLASEYGVPLGQEVATLAVSLLKNVMNWDQGDAPIYFQYSTGIGQ